MRHGIYVHEKETRATIWLAEKYEFYKSCERSAAHTKVTVWYGVSERGPMRRTWFYHCEKTFMKNVIFLFLPMPGISYLCIRILGRAQILSEDLSIRSPTSIRSHTFHDEFRSSIFILIYALVNVYQARAVQSPNPCVLRQWTWQFYKPSIFRLHPAILRQSTQKFCKPWNFSFPILGRDEPQLAIPPWFWDGPERYILHDFGVNPENWRTGTCFAGTSVCRDKLWFRTLKCDEKIASQWKYRHYTDN